MKIRYILLLFVAIVSLTVFGCTENEISPQTAEHPPLRVGWANWPGYYPLIIGVEQGFFADQGVAVEPVFVEGEASSNMLAGTIDSVLNTIASVIELEDQEPGSVRLVIPVDYSEGGDAFLATAEIKTPADLKAKGLCLLGSPFSLVFASQMLKEQSFSLKSVNQLDCKVSDALPLLDAGQAQAAHLYEPFLSQGLEQGYQLIYSSRETPGLIVDTLTFRTEVVQKRPDDVAAFINGWFAAVDWWKAHPDEGNAIMANALDLPVDAISTKGVAILDREAALQLFDREADELISLYETAELYSDIMTKLGILHAEPKLDTLIDPSFIE